MRFRQQLFIFLATILRALPKIRGKVRFGLYVYKKLNPYQDDFVIEAPLFRERLKFCLNLNCHHERMAYLMGHYENDTTNLLVELYAGGTFLDVGSNIGLITLPFAQRTKHHLGFPLSKPHVYAVEAMPSNYKSLCKNIELNNLQAHVKPLNIGLGADRKEAFIRIEGNNLNRTGTANILPGGSGPGKMSLQIHAIDELIANGNLPGDISLIKVDTDGYDFEILKGAKTLLFNQRPTIYAELSDPCLNWHGYSIKEVVEYLILLGYEVWLKSPFNPVKFVKYEVSTRYTQDCLLVPLEKVDKFSKFLVTE